MNRTEARIESSDETLAARVTHLPRRTRRRLAVLAGALTAVAAVSATLGAGLFGSQKAEAQSAPAVPPATPVAAARVVQQEVSTWQGFSGRLEAVERVELRPRVAGTVQQVHFREGSLVRAGDLLVTIDPAPYAADVARAEAQQAAADARVAFTQSEQQRAERLWQERAIAERELDERRNAAREADAQRRAAAAALQTARLNLSYTQVRAPVAGRVGRIEVSTGNLVAAGGAVLTQLVSVSPIYASFDADEKVVAAALKSLPGGASARNLLERIPVQMEALGTAHEGRLQLVDNQVDARSGTVRLRAVFDNRDGSLMPGQFAQLRMGQATTHKALLVNERAVGTDQDKRFVIVVGADQKAEWREVTLGAAVGGLRVVNTGLQGDELIVLSGVQRVRPGSLLDARPVPMDAKPELLARTAAPAADTKAKGQS